MTREPQYIGDGVYLDDDGYQLWLAANHHENRVVAIDPDVFSLLIMRGAQRFVAMGHDPETVSGFLDSAAAQIRRMADPGEH